MFQSRSYRLVVVDVASGGVGDEVALLPALHQCGALLHQVALLLRGDHVGHAEAAGGHRANGIHIAVVVFVAIVLAGWGARAALVAVQWVVVVHGLARRDRVAVLAHLHGNRRAIAGRLAQRLHPAVALVFVFHLEDVRLVFALLLCRAAGCGGDLEAILAFDFGFFDRCTHQVCYIYKEQSVFPINCPEISCNHAYRSSLWLGCQ